MTPDKDPSTYSLITYLWVTGLAAWGGLVNFYRKVKSGETRSFDVVGLIGEIATSAFAGLTTFWLCEAAQFDPLVTAALVGISGHMGSQTIYQLERWAQARLGTSTDNKERP